MLDLLVIAGLAAFCFGVIPVVGAVLARASWRSFRHRFEALRAVPLATWGKAERSRPAGERFRLYGDLESVSDDDRLWVRNADITACVDMKSAQLYLLPAASADSENADRQAADYSLQRIRWKRLPFLTEGVRVFVGGDLVWHGEQPIFASTPECPCIVILYEGGDDDLLVRTIVSGRPYGEYWNALSPFGVAAGVFGELVLAAAYANRPAFSLSMAGALVAALMPLYPLLPPALPIISIQKRLWQRGRRYRSWQDLATLPLRHLDPAQTEVSLGDSWTYRLEILDDAQFRSNQESCPPLLIPDEREDSGAWHVYTARATDGKPGHPDPGVLNAVFPGPCKTMARRCARRARSLELRAVVFYALGILLNAALAFLLISSFL